MSFLGSTAHDLCYSHTGYSSSVRASFKATKRLWLKIMTTLVSLAPAVFVEAAAADWRKCSTGTDFSTDTGAAAEPEDKYA